MTVFDFKDYREFLKTWMAAQPKQGWGQAAQLSRRLKISSVLLSQILNGHRELSPEHAHALCDFLGLSTLQTRYFMTLVEVSRAGTSSLKKYHESQLNDLRQSAQELRSKIPTDLQLSEHDKAIFYSDWRYSALRLATSIETHQSVPALAERFDLPVSKVRALIDFLVQVGLVVENSGQLQMGPSSTHLPASSPHAKTRHLTWRVKAMEEIQNSDSSDNLHYCAPTSISSEDAVIVKAELGDWISKFVGRVKKSKPQELKCLVIDWFSY